MHSGYPTYPNPTITEAVCDIHFRLPQEKEWKPSFPGELEGGNTTCYLNLRLAMHMELVLNM